MIKITFYSLEVEFGINKISELDYEISINKINLKSENGRSSTNMQCTKDETQYILFFLRHYVIFPQLIYQLYSCNHHLYTSLFIHNKKKIKTRKKKATSLKEEKKSSNSHLCRRAFTEPNRAAKTVHLHLLLYGFASPFT